MKRSPIIRKRPMKHRPTTRDRVTPELYAEVRLRDGGCLGPLIGMPDLCEGPIELDHVRVGGIGLRSPSVKENLACLCRLHHRLKTEEGRRWRPLLLAEIATEIPRPPSPPFLDRDRRGPAGSDASAEDGSAPIPPSPS